MFYFMYHPLFRWIQFSNRCFKNPPRPCVKLPQTFVVLVCLGWPPLRSSWFHTWHHFCWKCCPNSPRLQWQNLKRRPWTTTNIRPLGDLGGVGLLVEGWDRWNPIFFSYLIVFSFDSHGNGKWDTSKTRFLYPSGVIFHFDDCGMRVDFIKSQDKLLKYQLLIEFYPTGFSAEHCWRLSIKTEASRLVWEIQGRRWSGCELVVGSVSRRRSCMFLYPLNLLRWRRPRHANKMGRDLWTMMNWSKMMSNRDDRHQRYLLYIFYIVSHYLHFPHFLFTTFFLDHCC